MAKTRLRQSTLEDGGRSDEEEGMKIIPLLCAVIVMCCRCSVGLRECARGGVKKMYSAQHAKA